MLMQRFERGGWRSVQAAWLLDSTRWNAAVVVAPCVRSFGRIYGDGTPYILDVLRNERTIHNHNQIANIYDQT